MTRRSTDAANPSAPPVQRLRLRYAKRGPLRFTSHRDVARAFERALRRAGVPMALSQGFSPRPKVSWIGAAPTGAASEAEYLELAVVREITTADLVRDLDAVLPPGLDVLEAVIATPGSLADRIDASAWRIEVTGVGVDELHAAVDTLLAAESVPVNRLTKDGERSVDVRPVLAAVEVHDSVSVSAPDHRYGILDVVVRQSTPAVRPDDVMNALRVVAALEPPVPAKATRMAQGRLDNDGVLSDPLAPDRAAEVGQVHGEQETARRDVD